MALERLQALALFWVPQNDLVVTPAAAAQAEQEDPAPPGHPLIWVSIFCYFFFPKKNTDALRRGGKRASVSTGCPVFCAGCILSYILEDLKLTGSKIGR